MVSRRGVACRLTEGCGCLTWRRAVDSLRAVLETALSARETIDLDRWSSYLLFFVFARVVEQTAEVVFRTLLTW